MKLSTARIAAARSHLLGDTSEPLINHMYRLNVGKDVSATPPKTLETAQTLGWCDGAGKLTEIGGFISDSCREYVFWLGRDRKLPFEGVGGLNRAYFANKSVIEVGSGMGVNLMSLGSKVTDLAGVEPFEIYSQMGDILRAREGLHPVDVRNGSGENIPFPDKRFDVALCVSAHQYMDVRPALGELARILKPGGELIIIGGTLGRYVKDAATQSPGNLKAHVITVINTLGYMALHRRVIPARGIGTTSRPIYPLPGAMQRWTRQAGLDPAKKLHRVGSETVFRSKRHK